MATNWRLTWFHLKRTKPESLLSKEDSWHNRRYPVNGTGTRTPREHEKRMEVFPVPPNQREMLTA